MIDLITGLPGNAKTLYTIGYVKAWSERESRPVYYSGIPELTLPWTQIEPEKWAECPKGSIVVIDECQRIFRNRSLGTQPPKYVSDLETHRHLGIDLVFITQHPMLVDPAIRRLTGKHRHLVRIWGMAASTVHEWPAVRDNCDKPASRKDSDKRKFVFDKSIYKLYKSSEQHTGKVSVPLRAKLLILAPILIGLAGWYVYHYMQKKIHPEAELPSSAVVAGALPPGAVVSNGRQVLDPVADAKNYLFQNTPRIVGLPQTAPKYDDLTKPTSVPVPAACIERQSGCKCYTQQGTRLDVGDQICKDIVHNGYFQEFDPDGRRNEDARVVERSEQPQAPSVVVSDASASPAPIAAPLPSASVEPQHVLRAPPVKLPHG